MMRVYVIEDDTDHFDLLVRRIKKAFADISIQRFTSLLGLREYATSAQEKAPDCILLDLNIEDSHGLETFTGTQELFAGSPIVILSSINNEDIAMQAVKNGAQDFIEKDKLEQSVLSKVLRYSMERAKLLQRALDAELEAKNHLKFKSEFLAHFSHEIRTPLTAVIGLADILSDNLGKENVNRNYVDGIRSGGQQLLSVINDILDFSKFETGMVQINEKPTNVVTLVESVVNLFAAQAEESELILSLTYTKDVPYSCEVDPVRLKQIVSNLLSNALKYTYSGGVNLHLSYHAGESELSLQVTDTGVGIAESDLANLFEPYTQAGNQGSAKRVGTGIGLSLCQKLANLMGGGIAVTSKERKGSTFAVSIPLNSKSIVDRHHRCQFEKVSLVAGNSYFAELAAKLAESLEVPLTVEDQGGLDNHSILEIHASGKAQPGNMQQIVKRISYSFLRQDSFCPDGIDQSKHFPFSQRDLLSSFEPSQGNEESLAEFDASGLEVLVVDDIEVNRRVARAYLRKSGCVVTLASSGEEAIELIRQNVGTFKLIFLDCNMPELDGFQTALEISKIDPKVKMSALTGSDDPAVIEKCRRHGMHFFAVKPLSNEVIEGILESMGKIDQK